MDEYEGGEGFTVLVPGLARLIVPWVLLLVVLVVAWGLIGQYREASQAGQPESSGATEESASADETSASDETTQESTAIPESEPTDGETATSAKTVVVLIDGLNMRADATTSANVIKRLPLDSRLTYVDESPGWYKVRDEAGDEGWVAAGGKYTSLE